MTFAHWWVEQAAIARLASGSMNADTYRIWWRCKQMIREGKWEK